MPHLVEVWQEFKEQGIVILALSNEAKSTVQGYLEEQRLPFPVAAGCKSFRDYGVQGIPSAFLIDHEGTVIWQGHPARNDWVEMLPEALEKAEASRGGWDPGERHEALAKAVELARGEDLGGAWKESENLLRRFGKDEAIAPAVEAFQKDFLAEAERREREALDHAERGCYFLATREIEKQQELFKGSPPEKAWRDRLREWRTDGTARKLLKLDEERVEAMEIIRGGNLGKGLKKLRDLAEDAEGTPLADVIGETLKKYS